MNEHIELCTYCNREHDLRVACPEYAFRDIKELTKTPRIIFWLAKIFGKKRVGIDGNHVCVTYHWRGKIFVVSKFEI